MTVDEFSNVICEIFTCNCTRMRLATGLRPDPLGSLQRSPDPLAGFTVGDGGKKREEGTREGRRGRDKRERKGSTVERLDPE